MLTTNFVSKLENGANYTLIQFPNIKINLKSENIIYIYWKNIFLDRAKTWVTWVTWDKGQKFSQRGKRTRICKEERREWGLVIQRDWVWGQPDAIPHHKIFRRRKLAEWCVKLGRQIIVSTLFKKRYLSVSFVWAPSTIRNSVNNSMYRLHHFFNFSLLDKDAYYAPLVSAPNPVSIVLCLPSSPLYYIVNHYDGYMKALNCIFQLYIELSFFQW